MATLGMDNTGYTCSGGLNGGSKGINGRGGG